MLRPHRRRDRRVSCPRAIGEISLPLACSRFLVSAALPVVNVSHSAKLSVRSSHPVWYVLVSAALYFLAQVGSLRWEMVLHGNSGLWPAAAVGLIAIVGAPTGWRWRVAMATLAANVAAHAALGGLSMALTPNVSVRLLADWGGALVVVRVLGERPNLERSAPLLTFAALVGLLITPVVALVAALAIVTLSRASGPSLAVAFVRWYVPEVVMTLQLAPALWVALDVIERIRRTTWRDMAERGLALLATVAAIAAVALEPVVAGVALPISIVAVPVLLVAGYRYGVSFTACASVAMLATVLAITAAGAGPFAAAHPPGYARLVAAELYVGSLGISLVLLAAVLSDLRASSERFQSFLNAGDTAIIAVDLDRRIVGFSPAANRIFLDSAQRPLELGLDPLAPSQGTPEVLALRIAGWGSALKGASNVAILAPGPKTRLEMRYEPMRNADGVVVGAVATATDLVKREQAEQARVRAERLEAIGRLAGGIAHDVNNLMTIVLGQTYLLRQEVRGVTDATAALDEIDATIERTTRLTTQLLAFSRAQPIAPRVVALAEQVDASVSLLRRILEEHTIVDVEHRGTYASVVLDIGQFEQVLLNLATNARDAMPDGGRLSIVTDTATLEPADAAPLGIAAGAYATLEVRDSGRGIDPELLGSVFEPFFTTKGASGTGLGLATVDAVMQKLGGAVRATSIPGVGTTFTMWFPRSAAVPDTEQAPSPSETSRRASGRVLVCEDDEAIRRLVVRTLTKAGMSVHDAPTPHDALAWLDGDGRDTELLVSDIVMPGMSGVELMREARQRIPTLRVILMTGYADDKTWDLAAADSPDMILAKPFSVAALLAGAAALSDRTYAVPATAVIAG